MGGSRLGAEGQLSSQPCSSYQQNNVVPYNLFRYVLDSINVLCQQLLCYQCSLA